MTLRHLERETRTVHGARFATVVRRLVRLIIPASLAAFPTMAASAPIASRPPASAIATVITEGTRLEKIDDEDASTGARFFVFAGLHAFSVYLDDGPPAGLTQGRRYSEESLAVCFDVKPRHTYRIRPRYEGGAWLPTVIDAESSQLVEARVSASEHPSCYAVPPHPAGEGTMVPADASPVSRVRVRMEGLAPSAQPPSSPKPGERPRLPFASVHFETGVAFGGETLVVARFSDGSTDTLNAGDGFLFGIGAAWTPVWIHDAIGLGLGFDGYLKYGYAGGSNGSLAFSRVPVVASAHARFAVNDTWSILLRAGLERDLGANLSATGAVGDLPSVEVSSRVGGMVDIGTIASGNKGLGAGFAARFTIISYGLATAAVIPAANLGVVAFFNFDLRPQRR